MGCLRKAHGRMKNEEFQIFPCMEEFFEVWGEIRFQLQHITQHGRGEQQVLEKESCQRGRENSLTSGKSVLSVVYG